MYFLAKNIRTCSKTFRGAPDNVQLYKDGVLNWKYLAKNLSYFISHPEQIKQKLKEQDAHMLCQFFDSDEYKRRVTQFLEMQGRFLAKDTIKGKKGPGVKYQHVLSCAQPAHKKLFLNVIEASQLNSPDNLKKKRIKKCTIIEEIMKKKSSIDVRQDSTLSCFKAEVLKPKKSKHKSTIMPIFLKKIKMRREGSADLELEVVPKDIDIHYETARRIKSEAEEDSEPLYAQILLRKNVEQSSRALAQKQSERGKLNRIEPNVPRVASKKQLHTELSHQAVKDVLIFEHSGNKKVFYNPPRYFASATQIKEIHNKTTVNKPKNVVPRKLGSLSNVVPLRMASSAAKMPLRPPTVQLCPKKNMNLKSYSDFLCVQPPKKKTGKIDKKYDEDGKSVKIHVLKPEKKMKKGPSMLIEEVLKSKSLKSFKLDNNFEKRSTMMKVMENHKRKVRKSKKKNELIFMSLFQKVKLGTSQNATIGIAKTAEPAPQNVVEPTVLKPKKPEPIIKEPPKPTNEQQSFTYKIVAKNRERRDAKLKEKFQMNPPYWQNKFRFSFGKSPEEVPGNSDVLSIKNHGQTLEVVSKNISRSLHRPVPHFVDHANKAKPVAEFKGYRVLLYSVRDPDPTKMNFNDVVKGFCMYNDCVLSEDGLQEGYIVIFDMRDVCLGHLARVSLPALKCFMYYIQDAHPCRLKQIHVLNTATWIHHVMRLVVPLVRSELLNLVKFHKGGIPEDFPTEILPMDYGGEAPTVEELDTTTKSLLDKYREWLIESEHFKADESKRTKKAGWWGFFSSKSPQQVELDEKTILKNLQID